LAQLRASHERVKQELAEINYELAWRKFLRKYSPNQPRVPAGNPDGGQWTSGGGASGGAPANGSDGQVLSDESPDPIRPSAQYAQNEPRGRAIDLLEEQRLGGHAIEGHVGKSQDFLLARVRRQALDAERDGYAEGLKVGSFSSLESANKLVSATVARNPALVDLVASGRSGRKELDARFDAPTVMRHTPGRSDRSPIFVIHMMCGSLLCAMAAQRRAFASIRHIPGTSDGDRHGQSGNGILYRSNRGAIFSDVEERRRIPSGESLSH